MGAVLGMAVSCWDGSPVAAHVGSGISCKNCHSATRDGMAVTDFLTTTNLGSGTRKVFQVRPGGTAVIGINVTDGHNEYGLALSNLGSGGLGDASHRLNYESDPAWRERSNYDSVGPTTTNRKWIYNLKVLAGSAPDFYLINLEMAGTGGGRWSDQESFYLQVVMPTPAAPAISQPTYHGSVFSCSVPTETGFTYFLESKRSLSDPAWQVVAQTTGDGTVKVLSDPNADGGQGVYRVRAE